MREFYVIAITWNNYPDEPVRYITAGNTYPAPVKRYTLGEALDAVALMSGRADNVHLTFSIRPASDAD